MCIFLAHVNWYIFIFLEGIFISFSMLKDLDIFSIGSKFFFFSSHKIEMIDDFRI